MPNSIVRSGIQLVSLWRRVVPSCVAEFLRENHFNSDKTRLHNTIKVVTIKLDFFQTCGDFYINHMKEHIFLINIPKFEHQIRSNFGDIYDKVA